MIGFQANSQILKWNIIHPQTKKLIPLGEKGSVQEALIKSGYLPDPFYGENEKQFAWVELLNWTFESHLRLESIDEASFYELEFPSLDTYADVFVNDVKCGSGDNAFVQYRFDVKKLLKVGDNRIRVVFTSPINAKKDEAKAFVYPAPNDVGPIKVAPYCRKPQYQFGWDWSLRMVTMGLWEPAQLVTYKTNKVISRSILTRKIENNIASQEFALNLAQLPLNVKFIWKSRLFGSKEIAANQKQLSRSENIENPELWWPRGQGKQHLYQDHWTIVSETGEIIFDADVQFGVKTSEIIQKSDQWGTSFQVVVNGRDIFCKGGDYIPDDIFPSRITEEKLRKSVQTMAECNFNMVRIWGGGMYAQEAFLDECDKLGIMVWHDFMFACAMYPGYNSFLETVAKELEQQIPRIASHASLVLFNGNNEVDVAWKNWGFQDQFKISKKNQETIQSDYDRLFKSFIPAHVNKYSVAPYEHSSPLSNWGKDEFYNHGTQHYWGVWHGKDPMSNMGTKIGRFNAEYGFQSFPEYSTLNSFSQPSDWSLDSKVMKLRQKSYVGNGMIAKHSDALYGKTGSFQQFVYYSQLTQAEAVITAINAHRINKPRCSGTLYWQVNDCWPAISWSSMDYFGNWKALQYRVRDAYKDVAVLQDKTTSDCKYYMVSDIAEFFTTKMKCEVFDFQNNLLETFSCHRVVTTEPALIFEEELKPYLKANCEIRITYTDNLDKENVFTDYHLGKVKYDADNFPRIIDFQVDEQAKTGRMTIVLQALSLDFWIYSLTSNVHFSNNFLNLQKGNHVFEFTYSGKAPVVEDFKYVFR